jgi:hypothetical protein
MRRSCRSHRGLSTHRARPRFLQLASSESSRRLQWSMGTTNASIVSSSAQTRHLSVSSSPCVAAMQARQAKRLSAAWQAGVQEMRCGREGSGGSGMLSKQDTALLSSASICWGKCPHAPPRAGVHSTAGAAPHSGMPHLQASCELVSPVGSVSLGHGVNGPHLTVAT